MWWIVLPALVVHTSTAMPAMGARELAGERSGEGKATQWEVRGREVREVSVTGVV